MDIIKVSFRLEIIILIYDEVSGSQLVNKAMLRDIVIRPRQPPQYLTSILDGCCKKRSKSMTSPHGLYSFFARNSSWWNYGTTGSADDGCSTHELVTRDSSN